MMTTAAPHATHPKLILVMRHAEKPEDVEDPDLAPEGRARAKALASYIPDTFGKFDEIIVAAPSKHSERPYETVKPLSKAMGQKIDDSVADNDYPFLAHELLSRKKYSGENVLVCWHHGNIPSLLQQLGAPEGSYPDPWKPDVYNLILKVEYSNGGRPNVSQVIEPF